VPKLTDVVALQLGIFLCAGCGLFSGTSDSSTSATGGGGGGGGGADGTVVDCGDGTKVCMWTNAAMCQNESFYLRRVECAVHSIGAPSDFVDQTSLGAQCNPVDPPEGVDTPMLGFGTDPCSTCNLCHYRAHGSTFGGLGDMVLDELNYCPSILPQDVLAASICTDPTISGPVWTCPASLNIHGTVEEWNAVSNTWNATVMVSEAVGNPVCVYASDSDDARTNCEGHCSTVNQWYQDKEDEDPTIYRWTPFSCSLHASSQPAVTTNPTADCLNGGPMSSTSAPYKIKGFVSVVSSHGESALIRPIEGSADYSISNCQNDICDFTLTGVEFYSYPLSGSYTDAAGGTGSYTFSQIGMTMAQAATGKLDNARGVVLFDDDIRTIVSLQSLSIDGVQIGTIDNRYTSTSQAVGQLAAGGGTLNIIHQSSAYTIYITLNMYQ